MILSSFSSVASGWLITRCLLTRPYIYTLVVSLYTSLVKIDRNCGLLDSRPTTLFDPHEQGLSIRPHLKKSLFFHHRQESSSGRVLSIHFDVHFMLFGPGDQRPNKPNKLLPPAPPSP
jgi:hypothetical protein